MINFVAIIMIAIGAALGAEYGRRWAEAEEDGRWRSMLSANEYRVYTLLGALGTAFCLETGKLALTEPTTSHVWYLIAAMVPTVAVLAFHMSREQKLLWRELGRLKESRS
jgi:steroid 5-alpha reductase family enzyme